MRIRLALAAAALGLVTAVPAGAALPKLTGVVGPGFTITLKKGTTKVTSLKAGRYTLALSDRSSIHNFHLIGPGVNVKTGVAATGPRTFTVTLQKGKTYRFLCDPHPTSMRGSFRTF
jgi:hypothetical protein